MTAKSPTRARRSAADSEAPAVDQDLDRIDRQILKHLQQDGRMTVSRLAREVNLTVTPCFERVRRLEASGYIRGYCAELDPQRLGLGLLAYVSIDLDRTSPEAFERFGESMRSLEEVLECHMTAGGFDYLLKVRVRDVTAFRKLLGEHIAAHRGVQHTHTHIVLEEVKPRQMLAVP
jgi:Lrp/AsnC family transcriptional regulator, leucine-responsive regulatory protein